MMIQNACVTAREQMIDTMIDLTRLSRSHRVIVAGRDSLGIHLALHSRGFVRAATTATWAVVHGQYSAGFIAGDHSFQALEASIVRVAKFLSATATIAVSIEPQEKGLSLRVRGKLEQLGVRIEAGVRCQQGFVLSACRHDFNSIAKAA